MSDSYQRPTKIAELVPDVNESLANRTATVGRVLPHVEAKVIGPDGATPPRWRSSRWAGSDRETLRRFNLRRFLVQSRRCARDRAAARPRQGRGPSTMSRIAVRKAFTSSSVL